MNGAMRAMTLQLDWKDGFVAVRFGYWSTVHIGKQALALS
jgi:hypothetical protein